MVARALERRRLRAQTVSLRKELEGVNSFHNMIGKSPPMREVYGLLQRAAGLDMTVLLTGRPAPARSWRRARCTTTASANTIASCR